MSAGGKREKKRNSTGEQQRHEAVVRELKEHCFSDRSMKEWTFKNDKGLSENTVLAKLYVKDWETMKAENTGYLFWGAVGTGKSFLAGCIANALLEQEIEVRMNNFAEVLNDLSANFSEKNTYIKNLCRVPLLLLDDFGMERGDRVRIGTDLCGDRRQISEWEAPDRDDQSDTAGVKESAGYSACQDL